jgi:hypothetical protein
MGAVKVQKDDPQQMDYEAERHALFFTDHSCRQMYKVQLAGTAGTCLLLTSRAVTVPAQHAS